MNLSNKLFTPNSLRRVIFHYFIFHLLFILIVTSISSVGAFFHFQLDHELSLIESWLHHHYWQILMIGKVLAFLLLGVSFYWRYYQLPKAKELLKRSFDWPSSKGIVVALFWVFSLVFYGQIQWKEAKIGIGGSSLEQFFGLFFFYILDFFLLRQLLLWFRLPKIDKIDFVLVILIFSLSFIFTVPDYYHQKWVVIVLFTQLMFLIGSDFSHLSEALAFFLIFIFPAAFLWGWDPIWGDEVSFGSLSWNESKTLLAAVWMISFWYYRHSYWLQRIYFLRKAK